MAIHQQIYERLKEVAKNGDLITYGEIAPLANLNMENPDHRNKLAQILGDISTYENEQGRPLLSSIVVLAGEPRPGEGFFKLARHLNLLHGRKDDEEFEFFAQETKKVYAYWKNANE
jgi:hypothetical protein